MMQASPSTFAPRPAPARPRIFDGALAPGDPMRGGVLMLGNFDGFHRGHQTLAALARAVSVGRPVGLMSCEPHPRAFFGAEPAPFRLVTPAGKAHVLTGAGLAFVYQPRFDGAFAGQTPEAFIERVLVAGLGVSHVVAGPDFRFGRGRAGDVAMLRAFGQRLGFGVSVPAKLACTGGDVSSSRIRGLIRSGQMRAALALLGREWMIDTTRRADGSLHMDETLCRPRPGRYRARLAAPDGAVTAREVEIDIRADGRILPQGPVPAARRHVFLITGESA